jgi:hypothetical protein
MVALTAGVTHSPMQDMVIVLMRAIPNTEHIPMVLMDLAGDLDSAEALDEALAEASAEEDGGKPR